MRPPSPELPHKALYAAPRFQKPVYVPASPICCMILAVVVIMVLILSVMIMILTVIGCDHGCNRQVPGCNPKIKGIVTGYERLRKLPT
jgi:hypothetical protein